MIPQLPVAWVLVGLMPVAMVPSLALPSPVRQALQYNAELKRLSACGVGKVRHLSWTSLWLQERMADG